MIWCQLCSEWQRRRRHYSTPVRAGDQEDQGVAYRHKKIFVHDPTIELGCLREQDDIPTRHSIISGTLLVVVYIHILTILSQNSLSIFVTKSFKQN